MPVAAHDLDAAAVRFDDRLRDVEPETRSLHRILKRTRGAEETVEEMGDVGGRAGRAHCGVVRSSASAPTVPGRPCGPPLGRLWSVGFWLSFAATLGLVTLANPCERLLTRLRFPPMLATPLSTSLAAQLGTLPVMIVSFGRVAPFGLLANLLAVPIAGAVMLLFDQQFGTDQQQFDFVAFLDGREATRTAVQGTVDDLRKSWQRPKWDTAQQ